MRRSKNRRAILRALPAILLASLTGCASAPSVPSECPKIPALPVRVQTDESFQDQMQNFLLGSLPEPTNSAQP